MKRKLNLYTLLIIAYSWVVCMYCKPLGSTAHKDSNLFSITPVENNYFPIHQTWKNSIPENRVHKVQIDKAS